MRTLKYTTQYGHLYITYTFEIGDNSRPHTPSKLHTNKASIGYALRNKVEYHNATGTFRAYWTNNGAYYDVYSYNQLIARYYRNTGTVYINPNKYTVTTSRHQGMLWHLTNEAD